MTHPTQVEASSEGESVSESIADDEMAAEAVVEGTAPEFEVATMATERREEASEEVELRARIEQTVLAEQAAAQRISREQQADAAVEALLLELVGEAVAVLRNKASQPRASPERAGTAAAAREAEAVARQAEAEACEAREAEATAREAAEAREVAVAREAAEVRKAAEARKAAAAVREAAAAREAAATREAAEARDAATRGELVTEALLDAMLRELATEQRARRRRMLIGPPRLFGRLRRGQMILLCWGADDFSPSRTSPRCGAVVQARASAISAK